MKYELLVGLRYTRAERTNHFVSFLSLVSILGVALGVAALIVVLAVVNGFEHEFRKGVLGATPHVQVQSFDGPLEDWQQVAAVAERFPEVVASAPFINLQALLSNESNLRGVLLRGIDPQREDRAADLVRQIKAGKLDDLVPGERRIILGAELAKMLELSVGDRVMLVAPREAGEGAGALPRVTPLHVVGLFAVGLYDYDSALGIMHLDDLRELFGFGDRVSGVRLRLREPLDAPAVAAQLGGQLRQLAVTDWTRGNANLFHAVKTSKLMVVMVVSLLIAIATFNIVASLVMAVADKEADIAILRTLGASPGGIMRLFVVQGTTIGVIGTVAGVLVGVLLAWNVPRIAKGVEDLFGFKPISPEIYHISELPSRLLWGDVMLTACVALALSLLATLYPSWRAARLRPAEALRFE